MSLSLNELEALCRKAARGAGLPWGLAEEAGWAVRRLAASALPGAELLLARLVRHDLRAGVRDASPRGGPGGPGALDERRAALALSPRATEGEWRSAGGELCPILAGAALGDAAERLGARGEIVLHGVLSPLLLVPFAGLAARWLGRPVSVAWADLVASDAGDGAWLDDPSGRARDERAETVRCRALTDPAARLGAPLPRATRARPDPRDLARLEAFAARTCAPASDESRRRGAGGPAGD